MDGKRVSGQGRDAPKAGAANYQEQVFISDEADESGEIIDKIVRSISIDKLNFTNKDGNTSLHMAIMCRNKSAVKFLIEKGVSLDVKNDEGKTPLHLAFSSHESSEIAKLLLENGARWDLADDGGDTAFDIAMSLMPQHGHWDKNEVECVEFILDKMKEMGPDAKAIINTRNKNGDLLLTVAIRQHNLELAKLLLENGARLDLLTKEYEEEDENRNRTQLNEIVFTNSVELMKFIIENGARLDLGYEGGTVLHKALHEGNESVIKFIIKVIEEVGDHGKTIINTPNKDGITPLNIAINRNDLELAKLLIQLGAKLDLHDKGGNTILHKSLHRGNESVVKFIIEEIAKMGDAGKTIINTPIQPLWTESP